MGHSRPVTGLLYGAFYGGKGGRCIRLTNLQTSCAVVMKSGNLNFLEPSGPLQACKGTDLPLIINIITRVSGSFETSVSTASRRCWTRPIPLVPTECSFPAFLTITDVHLSGHGPVGNHVILPLTMGQYLTIIAI